LKHRIVLNYLSYSLTESQWLNKFDHMKMNRQKFITPLLLPLLALGFVACDKKESQQPASQVAAKVNSGEISVHQLNYVLARATRNSASSPENASRIRQEVLDRLVDQELAVEQAINKKLDRSPEVLMALDNARREILARAYLEQITAATPKPTVEEAETYYSEHPQLFAERRIYNIQEIVLPSSAGITDELRQMLDSGKPMEDIAKWLKGKEIKFAAGSATRSAEQIPLELLPKIHPLKPGQGLLIQGPQSITLMRIAAAQTVPITEAAALPRIQQFLGNQRATEAARGEIKALKAKANITYMGEFAAPDKNVSGGEHSAPSVASTTDTNSPQVDNTGLEKGAAGLLR
jgi:EpsD family peptidyl-prolyl cis-trans isomerase